MNRSYRRIQYFVEGQSEKKLIEVMKRELKIISGSVNIVNVTQKLLSGAILANLSSNTTVILIFDTDTQDDRALKKNLKKLKECRNVQEIWCIPQVGNLEEELIRATDVREIKDLIGSQSKSDFKHDWLKEKRLLEKLRNHGFDFDKFWATPPDGVFSDIDNCGNRIKLYGGKL